MFTKGQGIRLFCKTCGKEQYFVVKDKRAEDGRRILYATCPVCSSEPDDVDVLEHLRLENEWYAKEQYFASHNGLFFVVEAEPVPQGRPRFASVAGRFVHAYDPPESVKYKNLLKWHIRAFQQKYPNVGMLQQNIFLELKIFRSIPKAFSKKKRQEIREGKLYPVTKPDTDNYVKTVLDAANEIAFKDDSAVIGILARKYYSDIPRIEVALFEVENLSTVFNNEFVK